MDDSLPVQFTLTLAKTRLAVQLMVADDPMPDMEEFKREAEDVLKDHGTTGTC